MKWRSLQESSPDIGSRRLYEIFAERRELIARYVPADIQAIHAKVVEELTRAAIAEKALKRGDPAPDFELPDQNGKLVRSAELVADPSSCASYADAGARSVSARWKP